MDKLLIWGPVFCVLAVTLYLLVTLRRILYVLNGGCLG